MDPFLLNVTPNLRSQASKVHKSTINIMFVHYITLLWSHMIALCEKHTKVYFIITTDNDWTQSGSYICSICDIKILKYTVLFVQPSTVKNIFHSVMIFRVMFCWPNQNSKLWLIWINIFPTGLYLCRALSHSLVTHWVSVRLYDNY